MKLGLCLSGGGTKAFAHIGALKALEEENIKFDYLAGTSSGSIVATLYALGYSVNEIHDIFQKYSNQINYVDFRNILKILKHFVKTGKIKIDGLNSGEKIYKLMKKLASEKGISNISQIDKPLLIPAVNICNEDLYIFYSKKNNIQKFPNNIKYIGNADIAAVVQASCSYPGIFSPCSKIHNCLLIDGGIEENIPWREAKRVGADKVLSIVFTNTHPQKCCNSIIEILTKSFNILCHELSRYEWDGSDYLLEINHNNSGLLNKKDSKKLFYEGYIQTKKFIKENNLKNI